MQKQVFLHGNFILSYRNKIIRILVGSSVVGTSSLTSVAVRQLQLPHLGMFILAQKRPTPSNFMVEIAPSRGLRC